MERYYTNETFSPSFSLLSSAHRVYKEREREERESRVVIYKEKGKHSSQRSYSTFEIPEQKE